MTSPVKKDRIFRLSHIGEEMSISKAKLTFWANNQYNVCFSGKHGVGKTAQVKEIFNELYGKMGEDWLYFSASSMDPWVDFVGVPKEKVASDGVSYLTLVRPEVFARDQVKAIFIDEFNRSPKKVRNSVMELLQFGSINGHKFDSLKVIWTAINPPDEENTYDVEDIDPAQLDRFQVFVEVPYTASKAYFISKYGEDLGAAGVEWWNSVPQSVKDIVSPRRLDYLLDCYSLGGDLRDVLPKGVNHKDLLVRLGSGAISKTLETLFKAKDDGKTAEKLAELNFLDVATGEILKKSDYVNYFLPLFPSENFSTLLASSKVREVKKIMEAIGKNDTVLERVTDIINAKSVKTQTLTALKSWKNMHYSPLSSVVSSKNNTTLNPSKANPLLIAAYSSAEEENTYNRRENINSVASHISKLKKVDISVEDIAYFYAYLLIAVRRSHSGTCKSFPPILKNAVTKCNSVYRLEKYISDVNFKGEEWEKIEYKLDYASIVPKKVIQDIRFSLATNVELTEWGNPPF